jgi:hypothetical protein
LHPFKGDLEWQAIRVSDVDGEETPPVLFDVLEQFLPLILGRVLGLTITYTKWEDIHVVALQHIIHGDKNRV